MKNWSWQKWISKLWEFAIGLGGLIWALVEQEPAGWYLTIAGFGTALLEVILAYLSPKTS